jgi:hypothetical protein
MIRTLILASYRCLESLPNPTPPPLAQLHRTWALVHVKEYVWIVHALVLNTLVALSDETTGVFRLFHPSTKVHLPPFVDDFHLNIEAILDYEAFVSILAYLPHLSFGGLLGMVYELLWDCFVLDDFVSGFDLFFEVCGHIVWGHVPPSISCLFFTSWFFMLGK